MVAIEGLERVREKAEEKKAGDACFYPGREVQRSKLKLS